MRIFTAVGCNYFCCRCN